MYTCDVLITLKLLVITLTSLIMMICMMVASLMMKHLLLTRKKYRKRKISILVLGISTVTALTIQCYNSVLRHYMLDYNKDRRSCVFKLLPTKFMGIIYVYLNLYSITPLLQLESSRLLLLACAHLPI